MTSTPVSLNDESSLNDSWIDINSASQIHSPMGDESPEFMRPPHSLAESVQNLGLISFQVERFLQEAQRNQGNSPANPNGPSQRHQQQLPGSNLVADDNSGIYSSDTDISVDGFDFRAMITKRVHHHHNQPQPQQEQQLPKEGPSNIDTTVEANSLGIISDQKMSKSRDCLIDQLSDSLSIISRASVMGEKTSASLQDFEWLWDWTAQPEYFAGKEWKGGSQTSKQDYLMRQRHLYCSDLSKQQSHDGALFSGEVISLLFLTNILSIIIGAGLTYSMLMRRSF